MSSAPDQSPQGVIHDEADEDVTSGRHLRTDHDRRNNHRHKDRAGEDKAGTGEAAEPASLGERIVFRLKQWGITLSYLVVAVAIIALIRTFIIQSFTIPSGSMENTLNEGDRVTVTMYDSDKVHRGDVVVFTDPDHWLTTQEPTGLQGAAQDFLVAIRIFPQNAGHHLIKRVIGMPGDHVVADGKGSLTVNDRSNSSDSRYHQNDVHRGFVPQSNVVGVAKNVVWPYSHWSSLTSGQEVFSQVPKPTSTPTALPAGPAAPNPASTLAGSGD